MANTPEPIYNTTSSHTDTKSSSSFRLSAYARVDPFNLQQYATMNHKKIDNRSQSNDQTLDNKHIRRTIRLLREYA